MHYTHTLLVVLVGCLINSNIHGSEDKLTETDVIKANWKVGLHAYKLFALENEEKGAFFSPYSFTAIIFGLMMGSKGQTLEEFKKVTGLTGVDITEKYHLQQAKLYADAKKNKDAYEKLLVAKRFFYEESLEIESKYLNQLQSYYQISAQPIRFSNPDNAIGVINRWVAASTDNLIDAIVPMGDLPDDTKFLAVSGVFFQPRWQYGFDQPLTKPGPFKTITGISKTYPYMESTGLYNYYESPQFKSTILELPLESTHYAMYIIKPEPTYKLVDFEKKFLTTENLKAMRLAMKKTYLKLYLPKFEANLHYEMSSELRVMGVKSAMNPGAADFDGIFGDGAGKVAFSKYFTEAHFVFSEEGSTTKPETGTGPVTEYRADTPFMYAIICKESSAPFFMGRFTGFY